MAFAQNLDAALLKAGRTKADLSRHLGINTQAVSGWMAGGLPRPERIQVIADYLGCTTDDLLRAAERDSARASDRRRPGRKPLWARRFAAARYACWETIEEGAVDLAVEPEGLLQVENGEQHPSSDLLMKFHLETGIPMWWFSEGRMDGVPEAAAARIGAFDPALAPSEPWGPRRAGGRSAAEDDGE